MEKLTHWVNWLFWVWNFYFFKKPCQNILFSVPYGFHTHSKVTSSRPGYYLILDLFDHSTYLSFKFPTHKHSENHWLCYLPRRAPAREFTVNESLMHYMISSLKLHNFTHFNIQSTYAYAYEPRVSNREKKTSIPGLSKGKEKKVHQRLASRAF